MASSDNLIAMDSWILRPTFSDAWLMTDEAFNKDNEILARAFQEYSFPDNQSAAAAAAASNALDNQFYPTDITPDPTRFQTQAPTFSGGSETDTVVSKGQAVKKGTAAVATGGVNGGKITKRKRRKSKRSSTTVIMADPANFRWMVQQVTGFRLEGNLQLPVYNSDPVLRPDSNLMQQQSSSLPTFDTSSALLLESTTNYQQQQQQPAVPGASGQAEAVHGGGGFDFGSFCNFPTLDSWNA